MKNLFYLLIGLSLFSCQKETTIEQQPTTSTHYTIYVDAPKQENGFIKIEFSKADGHIIKMDMQRLTSHFIKTYEMNGNTNLKINIVGYAELTINNQEFEIKEQRTIFLK